MTLLSRCQAFWKLDLHLHDHVSPFVFVFTLVLRHTEVREGFSEAWWCGATAPYGDLFSVDGRYRSLPACEGFFEIQLNNGYEVVVLALEKRVFFL